MLWPSPSCGGDQNQSLTFSHRDIAGVSLLPADSLEAGNKVEVPVAAHDAHPILPAKRRDPEIVDGYWGAKHVMAFRDEQIRAIVEEGRFQDPRVVDYITKVLKSRRDAIGRAWFSQVLPLEAFRIVEGDLTFDDLAVQYGFSSPNQYQFNWFVWHNEAQQKKEVSASRGTALPDTLKSLAVGSYIGCRVALEHADKRSVTVYFRREGENWKLVGISRTTL